MISKRSLEMFNKMRQIAMIAVTNCLLMIALGLLNQQTVSAQTCTPAPVGLVSWWSGDGNALDSRSRNNGTLVGSASFGAGKVGQAFDFANPGGSVEIPDASNLNILSSFTAEAWIFPSNF